MKKKEKKKHRLVQSLVSTFHLSISLEVVLELTKLLTRLSMFLNRISTRGLMQTTLTRLVPICLLNSSLSLLSPMEVKLK